MPPGGVECHAPILTDVTLCAAAHSWCESCPAPSDGSRR